MRNQFIVLMKISLPIIMSDELIIIIMIIENTKYIAHLIKF